MDKSLKCVDCGAEFVFTAGEQEFYASQGFTSEPRRCPSCRAARKAGQGGSKGPRNGGAESSAANNARPPRQMFSAVCAECGKETQVPFQPTNGRPVYCSDCYRANNGGASRSGGSRSIYNNSRSNTSRSNNSYTPSTPSFDADFDMSSYVDMYPPPSSGGRGRNKRERRSKEREHDSWR